MSEKPKPKQFEIDEGTFIVSTSGGRTHEEDAMKRQADYSYQLVMEAFATGKLRIATENGSTRASDSDSQKNEADQNRE